MATFDPEPGVRLHWREAGAGRPLVLVHGWAMSSGAFAPQLASLAEVARVVTYDLRGHGRSTAPPTAAVAIGDHARDLVALVDDLALEGALLLGWSMGGQVALEALPGVRRHVGGLALLASTPRFTAGHGWSHGLPRSHVRALAASVAREPRAALERFFDGLFVEGELPPGRVAELRTDALGAPFCAPEVARAGLDALLRGDQRARLAEVDVPALVVHGTCDPICPPAAAEYAARCIRGARCHLLTGAGHAPQLSRPAEVNALLRSFLAELGS